jgi:hypothetical protein
MQDECMCVSALCKDSMKRSENTKSRLTVYSWIGTLGVAALCGDRVHKKEVKKGGRGKNAPWTKEVKDTNPLMSSSLVILFGAVKQF